MDPVVTAVLVFGCCAGGSLIGMAAAVTLLKRHLSDESKDVVRVATALIATLSALVLGFLVSSAKASFDVKDDGIKWVAVRVILLDAAMKDFGGETQPARKSLHTALSSVIASIWREGDAQSVNSGVIVNGHGMADVKQILLGLTANGDKQRTLRRSALSLTDQIEEARWNALFQQGGGINWPVVALLAFWFTVIFSSIGLFAPVNAIAVSVLLVCSLSISFAIYMLVQMDQPFRGLIQISSEPLTIALNQIGK